MNREVEIQLALKYSSDYELEVEISLYNHLVSELFVKELIDELNTKISMYLKEIRRRKIIRLNSARL